jgi:RimJ/RimL family protein N-acetyltransferase
VTRELGDLTWPMSTPRLTLRRARADDAAAVLSYRVLPQVSDWLGAPPADFSARFAAPERLGLLLMVERAGAVIGDLMVRVGDAWAPPDLVTQAHGVQAELGWALRPDEMGQGYATEAVGALLEICFQGLGLRRVTANCLAANTASYRLMERVSMRREALTVKDALHPSGEWVDGYSYALLAEEWHRDHA